MSTNTRAGLSNQLGGQATFFLAGNMFTLLVGLPFQIYVARVLGASNLGIFSLLEGGVGLVAGLLGLGLAPTLVRFIPHHLQRDEHGSIRYLLFRGFSILGALGLVAYLVLSVLVPLLVSTWTQLAEVRAAVYLMGLMIPLGLLMFFLQQGLRGFQEIRHMVIGSSFLQLTIKVIVTVGLFTAGMKLLGYITAVLLSTAVAIAWMGVGLWRKLKALKLSDQVNPAAGTKQLWRRYAGVQYSGSLVGLGSVYLDRFLLGIFAGAGPVGVLAVAKQLQQLPAVFLQMFLNVVAPMFSSAHARNDQEEAQYLYHLTTDWVLRASLPLFLFFMLFASPLLGLYGEEFRLQGLLPLWILVGGQMINVAFGPVGALLNMSGLEGVLLKITALQALLSSAGLLVMVPLYGLVGGAAVITGSVIFHYLGAMYVARQRLKLTWFDKRYVRWVVPFIAAVTFGLASRMLLPDPNAAILIGLLLGLYLVFHGVSVAQGLNDDDKRLLRHLYGKLRAAT